MSIRHIQVENFRGIKSLDWNIKSPTCCLLGPGDSCKSTILEAIRLALLPSWSYSFSDSDFWQCDTDTPISIKTTVGDIPAHLITENKFGLFLRGWSPEEGLADEPNDQREAVLTIELTVDKTFEPQWRVVNERQPEGKPITASQRTSIGMLLLSPHFGQNFTWGKNAILSKLTDNHSDDLPALFAAARRSVKDSITNENLQELQEVSTMIEGAVPDFGVSPQNGYSPKVDLKSITINTGAISLHDGQVPVRSLGTGTQKLINLAMFREAFQESGILALDEVETGLEPHRIRQLISLLSAGETGTTLMTTHSPIVLKELDWPQLHIVREADGNVEVKRIGSTARSVIRATPEAFLANKVLVCEGKTEIGVLRACNAHWQAEGSPSIWSIGIELVDGGGESTLRRASAFVKAGYEVCCFIDSDKLDEQRNTINRLVENGALIVHWDENNTTDEVIINNVSETALCEIWKIVAKERTLPALKQSLESHELIGQGVLGDDPSTWPQEHDIENLRQVSAIRAKSNRSPWFKRVDLSEQVSALFLNELEQIAKTDLANKIGTIQEWVHD